MEGIGRLFFAASLFYLAVGTAMGFAMAFLWMDIHAHIRICLLISPYICRQDSLQRYPPLYPFYMQQYWPHRHGRYVDWKQIPKFSSLTQTCLAIRRFSNNSPSYILTKKYSIWCYFLTTETFTACCPFAPSG